MTKLVVAFRNFANALKNRGKSFHATIKVGLEVNQDKIKCMFMSREENAVP
jgi:hypothetical protein